MKRITWVALITLAPICCCFGRLSDELSEQAIVQEVVNEVGHDVIILNPLPTLTRTPASTPTKGEENGGDPGNDSNEAGPGSQGGANVSSTPATLASEVTSLPLTATATPSSAPQLSTPTQTPSVAAQPPSPTATGPSPPVVPTILTLEPTASPSATPIPTLPSDNGDDDDDDGNETGSSPTPPTSTLTATPVPTPTFTPTSTPTSPSLPEVAFSASAYSANENSGLAIITVTLSAISAQSIMVDYATSDHTAVAGSDYTATSGTLTFAPGQISQNFNVALINDGLTNEFSEIANLSLSNPTQATLTTPGLAPLTIVDDDGQPAVQFNNPAYNVAEDGGIAIITVTLSAPSALPVTVDYATSDGTATAGTDYIATTGALLFAPLQVSLPFTVPVSDDPTIEADETVNLTLITPTNAILGLPNPALLTITNEDGYLYVSSNAGNVLRYNPLTGTFVDIFASGLNPNGLTFGPDGHLYVSFGGSNAVWRYDPITGADLGVFANFGLSSPNGLRFGPDSHLYVSSNSINQVRRYDGTTGAFIDIFASGGGLIGPSGLVFGPDGNLYVSSSGTNQVFRYQGTTGAFIDIFINGGGLSGPNGLVFGPDNNLYVSSSNTNQVRRYDGTTGTFIDNFASGVELIGPGGLVFGPDGHLYVSSSGTNEVLRYDGVTGVFSDTFVTAGNGGLNIPTYLIFSP